MRSLRGKENELQQQTPNKPISTKHFMSPTLSEDYSVSIYTNEQQTLASPTYPLSPVTTPTASKPYDPLADYLTPRPKFLLYNPDKQRDKVGLIDSQEFHEISSNECSSSLSSPQHESVKEEGLECTDFEDDSDEEKQGLLYKVVKFLFVLAAIVFSTLYISSMNSPKNGNLLPLQGYQMILDQSFQDSPNDFALGSVFWSQTLGKETNLRDATQSVILDQIHLPDGGEIDTANNVLQQVLLEDSNKLFDPLDLPDKGETTAATLRLPYVTDIQDLPISVESTDEKVSACEGSTGGEDIVFEHQAETAVNVFYAIQASYIVDNTNSSEESAKMEEFSYIIVDNTGSPGECAKMEAIDEKRIILGDILSTCEVVNAERVLSDDQTMRTEAMLTDVVLAMGGIASLVGGNALLAIILRFIWRLFTKPFQRVPSPVIQECVEPALVEDSRDSLLANKDESTEEKEQFVVDQRLIEQCHFRAPTIELLREYVVTPGFIRSSPKKFSCESSPVEPQQMKQGTFPDRPSISSSCSNTSLNSSRRFNQDKTLGKEVNESR